MLVRPLADDDWSWKRRVPSARLGLQLGGPHGRARRGGRPSRDSWPWSTSQRVGLLTYDRRGDDVEIVTLHAEREGAGVGRALMDAVFGHARTNGVRRMWLVTTNDNVRASVSTSGGGWTWRRSSPTVWPSRGG